MSQANARSRLGNLRQIDGWLVLAVAALALCGLVFIGSATQDDPQFEEQQGRQTLFLVVGAGIGSFVLLPHYVHLLRSAWLVYGAVVVALLGLPFFAPEINGARRWYTLPGFYIQPSEFAKLAVIIALAALLRFRTKGTLVEGLLLPMAVAAVPALLVLRQPDLGSSLVFAPVTLAMCFAAGVRLRRIGLVLLAAAGLGLFAWFELLHDYQRSRVDVWLQHWQWGDADLDTREVREVLEGPGFQPWQALIAIGSGGWLGHGLGLGPQNRYDFLPYRSEDYVFAVVAEETGWLGCVVVLALVTVITLRLLRLALRTRERFGRLVCVGIATWLGAQSLLHVAICCWLVPSKGLPMPLLSYGGSSTLAVLLGLAICLNIGSRREPILGGDGFG
jgi:rod shape determining protein RodA